MTDIGWLPSPRVLLTALTAFAAFGLFIGGVADVLELSSWVELSALVIALVAGVAAPILTHQDERGERKEKDEALVRAHIRFAETVDLPRVSTKPAHEVGAWPIIDQGWTQGSALRYVARQEADNQIRSALRRRQFVLVVGATAVGKTRSLYEAARDLFPERHLMVPLTAASLKEICQPEFPVAMDNTVIWLDELERYVNEKEAAGPIIALLDVIKSREDASLLATVSSGVYDRLRFGGAPSSDMAAVLAASEQVRLEPFTDAAAAAAVHPDANESFLQNVRELGLGASLIAGPALVEAFTDANKHGFAIVRAAVDWERTGMERPVPRPLLEDLYLNYLDAGLDADEKNFEDGLSWARRDLVQDSGVALLQLADRGPPKAFRAHAYITDRVRAGPDPVQGSTWERVIDVATPDEQHRVGLMAYIDAFVADLSYVGESAADVQARVGRRPFHLSVAKHAWERAAASGSSRAMLDLASLLADEEDDKGAEQWYRKADQAGDAEGTLKLAELHARRGATKEAERLYLAAASGGHPEAMVVLGALAAQQGDQAAADKWYEQATSVGSVSVGLSLSSRGHGDEAKRWYEGQARAGSSEAMMWLGRTLDDEGDRSAAEHWYRKAAALGEIDAYTFVASHVAERDRIEARAWLEKAAAAGDLSVAEALATLRRRNGGPHA